MAAATRHSGSRALRSRAPPARSLSDRILLPGPRRRAAGRAGDRRHCRGRRGGTAGGLRHPSGCCSPAAALRAAGLRGAAGPKTTAPSVPGGRGAVGGAGRAPGGGAPRRRARNRAPPIGRRQPGKIRFSAPPPPAGAERGRARVQLLVRLRPRPRGVPPALAAGAAVEGPCRTAGPPGFLPGGAAVQRPRCSALVNDRHGDLVHLRGLVPPMAKIMDWNRVPIAQPGRLQAAQCSQKKPPLTST
ncbi:collagen alpha-1(I) chain-like [Falco naumanni]|uniref:collagen alpha-1(I) chain-like n=1 Tax=Falco naumanni TaxID=148594 RepID=UPI001ADE0BCA|nr:collagen alpha-1(I) chain-like [Falco naumanni]